MPFLVILLHRNQFSNGEFLRLYEISQESNLNAPEGLIIYRITEKSPGLYYHYYHAPGFEVNLKLFLKFDFWILNAPGWQC